MNLSMYVNGKLIKSTEGDHSTEKETGKEKDGRSSLGLLGTNVMNQTLLLSITLWLHISYPTPFAMDHQARAGEGGEVI